MPTEGAITPRPDASTDSQPLANFFTQLDRASRADDFVGLAVAVVHPVRGVEVRTYGLNRVGQAERVSPRTTFRIASLSKGFAASLASLSVAEGRLSLNDPVAPRVPEFALTGDRHQGLTVDHLLSHRVGLPPNAYDNLLEADVDPVEILSRLVGVEMICSVGQCYAYQNVAFNMIVPILEQATGTDYATLLAARIFEPLGMYGASVGREALIGSQDWARPHVRRTPTQWVSVDVKPAYYRLPGASGINASIEDMATWLLAQLGNIPEVLPDPVLAQMHRPRVESRAETRRWRRLGNRVRTTHYGLGWRIYDYAGETLITHSGSVEGYMAQIALLPEHEVGIVVLANTRARRAWRILPTFLDAQLQLKPEDWLELEDLEAELEATRGGGLASDRKSDRGASD